ncbi:NAD(P)H-dependent oxidoreductase [Halosquirtibacter laminarini]|uniref:NAD(P)H-dependent oxidoreductase n=1 Tax=Halosquirtibacter laminarini TaxID=3374600 RepID=A0AC61NBG3_9BACT|nr:NAD(P)H-dependent oxidoreductase [Prolixibacteraceae bacterium]
MQKTLIIYGDNKNEGYLHELTNSISKNLVDHTHSVDIIRLNEEPFYPIRLEFEEKISKMGIEPPLDVHNYLDRIENAQEVIFIFPLWWSGYPAILKGFIDRIFIPKNYDEETLLYNQSKRIYLITQVDPNDISPLTKEDKSKIAWCINDSLWGKMGYTISPVIWVEDNSKLSYRDEEDRKSRIFSKLLAKKNDTLLGKD